MTDAIYRDEHHAIIRAMAVDSISTCKPAEWQQQHSSGYVEELTKKHDSLQPLTTMERLTQDCMTRALIHRTVPRSSFYAMVAKYGADEQERATAVNELVKYIRCEASDKLKAILIWAWASVSIKRGLLARLLELGEQSQATLYRRRKEVFKQLDAMEEAALSDVSPQLQEMGLTGA